MTFPRIANRVPLSGLHRRRRRRSQGLVSEAPGSVFFRTGPEALAGTFRVLLPEF